MSYKHGVYTSEVPTSLLPPRRISAGIPVVFGTAPVHTLAVGAPRPVNEPVLCNSYQEFVDQLGWSDDYAAYTLCEAARVIFGLYGIAPAIFVNVFDPEEHVDAQDDPDVSKVVAADILGGVDAGTGALTGLELVAQIFPRFRLIPGTLLAPKFSADPAVAVAMAAKAQNINGLFQAVAAVDIPDATVTKYQDVPAYKEANNLTGGRMLVSWGRPVLGDETFWGSSHLAALMAFVDSESGDVPYRSPSNNRLLVTGAQANGKPLYLGLEQANYLNGQGVNVPLNWDGGWKCWGNRTGAYPSVTDPKDSFIPIRRFFNWHANTFILTYFQLVDWPITRRLLQTVADSEQIRLNAFTAREYILGGRIALLESENPTTDVMDGIIRFHTWMTPPSPARQIENILEYDPIYIQSLFA